MYSIHAINEIQTYIGDAYVWLEKKDAEKAQSMGFEPTFRADGMNKFFVHAYQLESFRKNFPNPMIYEKPVNATGAGYPIPG